MGEVLVIYYKGVRHYGIYSERGSVIHASKRWGKVVESSMSDFCGGRKVVDNYYPSSKRSIDVLAKARSLKGTKWNLFKFNCEQFVNLCYGNKHSKQLRIATLFLVVTTGVFFLRRK